MRTRSYTSCATLAGDGLALVLLDAATAPSSTTVGAGGGALGYGGLRNSVAIEFDTLGDPSLQEPALPHVAVLSRGVRAKAGGRIRHHHLHRKCDLFRALTCRGAGAAQLGVA